MDIPLELIAGIVVLAGLLAAIFELRIRQPDVLVLYEARGKLEIRSGPVYPVHFSLPIKRTTRPIQLTAEVSAAGNLGVRVKLVGSVAPSLGHIQSLVRIGGWNSGAVARAADETQVYLQGLVKEYAEHKEIHVLSSSGILEYLNGRAEQIKEKFGVELVTLAVQSLDPTDPEIVEALRQQEQARLLEQTERLNHQARVAAAKTRYQADEEIAEMEHVLELKKAGLKQILLEREAELARQRLEDELAGSRLRLAYEREELELLKSSPELLILTPQAARLAEASQSLKNARTVISLAPQDLAGPEIINLFQNLLQKALDTKKADAQEG